MSRLEFARKLQKQINGQNIEPKILKGKNVVIHTGVILGSEGFGFERNEKYESEKVPRIGGVILGDNVEIGSIVRFIIEEQLPSAGIDISSASVYFDNGFIEFDITDDLRVSGDPYEYTIE